MGYNDKTSYVGNTGLKYYPYVLLLIMLILSTSFEYFPKAAQAVYYLNIASVSREPRVLIDIVYDGLLVNCCTGQPSSVEFNSITCKVL